MIELSPHLMQNLGKTDPFGAVMRLKGSVFREHKHRRTLRVELDGRGYFVKIHGHTGPLELLKNAFHVRWPVLTAQNERDAIRRLDDLGVPTMRVAGYGCRGTSPAYLESFIITDALDDMVSLEELCIDWGGLTGRARVRLQRTILREVASISRSIHRNGLNHRDFYLCHFLVPAREWSAWRENGGVGIHLIDLHRAQLRSRVPKRWIVKDLAGLLFSSLDAGFTARDYARFLSVYFERPWRRLARRRRFLRRVVRRAIKLYRSERGRPPRLPAGLASYA